MVVNQDKPMRYKDDLVEQGIGHHAQRIRLADVMPYW